MSEPLDCDSVTSVISHANVVRIGFRMMQAIIITTQNREAWISQSRDFVSRSSPACLNITPLATHTISFLRRQCLRPFKHLLGNSGKRLLEGPV